MSYFVPVKEPDEARRELLNANKQVITALRRYEHFRQLRKAKLEAFHELANEWNEMAKLQRKLKLSLPKTDIKAMPAPRTVVPAPVQKAPVEKKPLREHKSKLQLLEDQLSKIESKLQGI